MRTVVTVLVLHVLVLPAMMIAGFGYPSSVFQHCNPRGQGLNCDYHAHYTYIGLLAVTVAVPISPSSSSSSSLAATKNDDANANTNNDNGNGNSNSNTESSSSTTANSYPWRVVMDIGREPLARMPFNWARQGARMPLVIPSDFLFNTTRKKMTAGFVKPQSETAGFTDSDGAKESPTEGGEWRVSEDCTSLTFSYTIVNELRRRDVFIEAGTELVLSTRIYTQTELDRLNQEYYKARENLWSTGGNMNDASDRQQSNKKWNTKTERWEKRYPSENPFSAITNQVSYFLQKAKEDKARNQRPEPETLSDRGGKIPGVGLDEDGNEGYVYLVQEGVIRYGGETGPVCGLWTAQPITNVPAWDRGK